MVQVLPASNKWATAGHNFGQGISEQIPKEVEHYRLSQGLKNLQSQKNLSPSEFYTQAASIYGTTPEMHRQLGELARERQRGENFVSKSKIEEEAKPTFMNPKKGENPETDITKAPSITKARGIEATTKPFIPRQYEEIRNAAAQSYESNPAFYKNDPQNAINEQVQIDQQENNRSLALQGERKGQQDVQNTVKSGVNNQIQALKADIPANVKSKLEDEAIKSVLSKEDGGEGLTEQEALKKYGAKADEISRDYNSIKALGNYSFIAQNPENARSSIDNLREKFKERDDLENFADTLIAKNGISTPKGYYLAYKLSENKPLNNFLVKLPEAHRTATEDPKFETLKIAPKIASMMEDKVTSPLAIYEELNSKGYDGDAFLNYLVKERKNLNLSELQGRQLDKPRTWMPNANDRWLFLLSGLDKLVEQE
jgi:hypothetical protein